MSVFKNKEELLEDEFIGKKVLVAGGTELNDPDSPGETMALMEVFGLENITLKRFPYASRVSYFIVE